MKRCSIIASVASNVRGQASTRAVSRASGRSGAALMAVTARITTAGFDSAPPKPCRAQVLEPEVVSGGAASDAMRAEGADHQRARVELVGEAGQRVERRVPRPGVRGAVGVVE